MTTVRVTNCTHQERRRLELADLPRGWVFLGLVIGSWAFVVLIGFGLAFITQLAAGV